MKKYFSLCLVLIVSFFIIGCSSTPTPKGLIYTGVKGPFLGTSNAVSSKIGASSAKSLLGLFAWGDASIDSAAKKAGITKIHHVDYKDFSFLGIYQEYTIEVYGD